MCLSCLQLSKRRRVLHPEAWGGQAGAGAMVQGTTRLLRKKAMATALARMAWKGGSAPRRATRIDCAVANGVSWWGVCMERVMCAGGLCQYVDTRQSRWASSILLVVITEVNLVSYCLAELTARLTHCY